MPRDWLQAKLATAKATGLQPLDLLFDVQRDARADSSRWKSLLVGRRGGKTTTVVVDLADGLLNDEQTDNIFVAQTSVTARDLCWIPLERAATTHGWPIRFDHGKLIATGPKGARLAVVGSETIREIEKRRGPGYRRMRVDECGAIRPSYLRYMVEDVFEPMMMDSRDASIWLSGTPNPAPVGYFHDVTTGAVGGWKNFYWTYTSNPHLDSDFVPMLMERRGWDDTHPKFRREYLALWESDPSRLVFRFSEQRNVVESLPRLGRGERWIHVIGLDFGVGDATSLVVLAYPSRTGDEVYAVHSWAERGLAPSDAAARIRRDVDRYQPDLLVADVGGLGKAYQAEWNRRFPGVEMLAADKRDKRGTLEIVSDALYVARPDGEPGERRGLMTLACNGELRRQWASLVWDEDREDIAEGQDDDVSDAAMYAFKACPAFANAAEEAPPPVDVRGTTWEIHRPRTHAVTPERHRRIADSWDWRRR